MGLLKSFIRYHLRPHGIASDGSSLRANSTISPIKVAEQPHSHEEQIRDWVAQGLPAPPPNAVKQAVIRAYARRHGTKVLVETGTYFGDMVEAMKNDFEHVYSIELSQKLFEIATVRFQGEPNVTLIRGDSGDAIKLVLMRLSKPSLFWLDSHWSGDGTARGSQDTPVREEIEAILSAQDLQHVILIDDARGFGADPAYPTIEELRQLVLARRPHLEFQVDVDIIRINPAVMRLQICSSRDDYDNQAR